MSVGQRWIDEIMLPLSAVPGQQCPVRLTSLEYNRIYDAVSRGTPDQGRALVQSLRALLERIVVESRGTPA